MDQVLEQDIIKRPSWDEYFMTYAMLAATRSTCLRRRVGAVAIINKRILATGYNGAPSGIEDCLEKGYCKRERLNVPSGERHELCRGLHAEQNLIIQAAKTGVSLEDSIIYSTTYPCIICAKQLINIPIKEVNFLASYADNETEGLFEEAGIKMIQMEIPHIKIWSNYDQL